MPFQSCFIQTETVYQEIHFIHLIRTYKIYTRTQLELILNLVNTKTSRTE